MSLEALFAEVKKIKVNGVEVEIKHAALEDIPLLTDIVSKIFSSKDIKKASISLIQTDFDKAKKVITSLTNIPSESVSRLSIDASIAIVSGILEENVGFFIEKVVPQIQGLQEKIIGLTKSKG